MQQFKEGDRIFMPNKDDRLGKKGLVVNVYDKPHGKVGLRVLSDTGWRFNIPIEAAYPETNLPNIPIEDKLTTL